MTPDKELIRFGRQKFVVKDGIFYVCKPIPRGYKCGKCLRGLIYLFGRQSKCKVCGARIVTT